MTKNPAGALGRLQPSGYLGMGLDKPLVTSVPSTIGFGLATPGQSRVHWDSGLRRRTDALLDVIVADTYQMVRAGFAALISAMNRMRVVGEAARGAELLALLATVKPDVVIVDLALSTEDGRPATREIRDQYPDLPLLALTMDDSPESIQRVRASGAGGYLSKSATPDELEVALRNVATSGVHLSAEAVRQLLNDRQCDQDDDELTPRQQQIVEMFAQGKSAKQIAFELGLSVRTVDVHRARIFHRLNVSGLAGLTLYALRRGLIEP